MPASLPVINGSANNWGTLLNAWLQVAHNADGTPSVPVTSVTGTYTALSSDTVILANATSGAFTTTLPTAVGIPGKSYTVLKSDSGSNAVTVGTTSGQVISGKSSFSLPYQYSVVTVLSDGANWETVYAQNPGRSPDWVSVKAFGAIGDGVADDTAAIQAAINYLTGSASPATTTRTP